MSLHITSPIDLNGMLYVRLLVTGQTLQKVNHLKYNETPSPVTPLAWTPLAQRYRTQPPAWSRVHITRKCMKQKWNYFFKQYSYVSNREVQIWNNRIWCVYRRHWFSKTTGVLTNPLLLAEYSGRSRSIPWASYQIHKMAGCACAGNAGNVFPTTVGWGSRHASRHVRHARDVIAN